jgi:membrane protease YdiL (CAAX protease family)
VVPALSSISTKKTLQASGVCIATTLVVLLGAFGFDLVDINLDYNFDLNFFVYFFCINLFFTCLAEEVFFRGMVQDNLYKLFKTHSIYYNTIPVFVTGLLFGVVHLGFSSEYAVFATIAGIGYGIVYQLTRSVEYAIVSHFFLNLCHLLFFSYPIKLVI